MLDDPEYFDRSPELLRAMVAADGKAVGKELNRRLELDVSFWSSERPTLKENWWNEDVTPESPLRNRYSQTISLVYELTEISYRDALSTGEALRSVWVMIPPLARGDRQMIDACNKLIEELQPTK